MSRVKLLRFPPPYLAALAISNDVDDLWEPAGWWEFLRYLNTADATRFGDGLDMEVGDSFWFWSDHPSEQPGAYFDGLEHRPSRFAPAIGALGRAGYLDTLHSYGNFTRHGGFRRSHAELAAKALENEGFAPTVWVNHGGAHDFQNLWTGCGDIPENPEAKGAPAPEYHLDLTWKLGFRYAWLGELTRVPGQERMLRLSDWLDPGGAVPREAMAYLGRGLARRVGFRDVLEKYPNYGTLGNRLLGTRMLRDHTRVRTFVRYGDFERATFADLGWILRKRYLDTLERTRGVSIVFVHWCRHPGRSFENLDPVALEALRELARRCREKRIWVTTTGRLLTYCEARSALRTVSHREGGVTKVHIHAGPLPDGRSVTVEDLAGISFRVSDPDATEFFWEGEPLSTERVPGEPFGVWIPWPPLRFPEPPGAAK